MNLRVADKIIYVGKEKQRVVLPTMTGADVVTAVFRVTHPELVNPISKSIHPKVSELYQEFSESYYLSDDSITQSLDELVRNDNKTDLIRGLKSFEEVAHDHYGLIYDQLLLGPAKRLAAWLVSTEREIDLPEGGL